MPLAIPDVMLCAFSPICSNLYQVSKDLRNWPDTTATTSLQNYDTGVATLEKKYVLSRSIPMVYR